VSASVRSRATRWAAHRNPWSIAAQLFAAELVVVALVTGIAALVSMRATQNQVEKLSGERALAIARSVAATPEIRAAFANPEPAQTIQPIAEAIRLRSGADFVVVANTEEIRYSHPDPVNLGKKLSTPAGRVLLGEEFTGTERGTLGLSVRGKTPVLNDAGNVIGLVSVGLLIEGVQQRARADLLEMIGYLASGAVLLGGCGAWMVARRVRRQTFALNADGIGSLLEHREAILGSVKEGVVAIDLEGRITLANPEAVRLLGLPTNPEGMLLTDCALADHVVAAIREPTNEIDVALAHGNSLLIANRRPVVIRNVVRGAIVTLRDRTEIDQLTAELAGSQSTAETLRAQAHEFSNKLHTISGLIALESYAEAQRFISNVGRAKEEVLAAVSAQIDDRRLAALVVAKRTLAMERGIELALTPTSCVQPLEDAVSADVLLVVGNLLDNALQAIDTVAGGPTPSIELHVMQDSESIDIRVRDEGPGVGSVDPDQIFDPGFSTKPRTANSGLGLTLARNVCERRGGSLRLTQHRPATFHAELPLSDTLPDRKASSAHATTGGAQS
jgi:two-component system, CitB family, sensor kinase